MLSAPPRKLPLSGCRGRFCGHGTTTVAFGGGPVAPGESCSLDVAVSIPPGVATGLYTNPPATWVPMRLVMSVASAAGADPLVRLGHQRRSMTPWYLAWQRATLQFTISNAAATEFATAIAFTDDLDGVLSGTVATGLPMNDVCGPGSQLSGSGVTTLSSGKSCCGCQLYVSGGFAASTDYSTTSQLSAEVNLAALIDPARDSLTIDSELLALSKPFCR